MNNDWLDIAVLEDYLEGKLDAKTMNRVEREALDDPFVAEALAGLSTSPKRSLESLSLLQKQLRERIEKHVAHKRTSVITWQRLSIASVAAVLFISVSIIFWMKEVNFRQMEAKQSKKVDVVIAPKVFKERVVKSVVLSAGTGEPADGWNQFSDYLDKNNKFKNEPDIHQSVEISFTIGKDGTPEDLKIVKSIAKKYDEEAIRLILNGPKWNRPTVKEGRINLKVSF